MTRREQWVSIFVQPRPHESNKAEIAQGKHDQLLAILKAFEAIDKVVHAEPAKYGEAIVFKARRR